MSLAHKLTRQDVEHTLGKKHKALDANSIMKAERELAADDCDDDEDELLDVGMIHLLTQLDAVESMKNAKYKEIAEDEIAPIREAILFLKSDPIARIKYGGSVKGCAKVVAMIRQEMDHKETIGRLAKPLATLTAKSNIVRASEGAGVAGSGLKLVRL